MLLSNHELNAALSRHRHTRQSFIGCFAIDNLPEAIWKFPSCLICNTTTLREGGDHWILLIFPGPSHTSEFFDSLGRAPNHYSDKFVEVLNLNGDGFIYNKTRLQSEFSTSCGPFTAFIADMRNIGYTLETAVSKLSSTDLESNDGVVDRYFIGHISKP